MRWLELSVEADVEAVEAVSEILGRVSAGTAVLPTRLVRDPDDEMSAAPDPTAPFVITAHVTDDADAATALDSTERALWHLQAFGLGDVGPLQVRATDDAAWADAWKRHYAPQRIGRLVIVPSWLDEPLQDGEVAITLDPGMAFGTGLHPTTRGCLELLQELRPMPPSVLDVGCGSGILALAALRLGVGRAIGYDTDPLAVTAARDNAERNGLGHRFEARQGRLPATATDGYALVLANLVAAVLVGEAETLAAHLSPDGVLLAGGILGPREAEVATAMAVVGLTMADRRADGEWVTLRLERAP